MSEESPGRSGWRWPAEWEGHAATWLSWPHNLETWPGNLAAAEAAFVAMVRALLPRERVCINVRDAAMEEHVRALLGTDAVELFHFPTDDAWVRDHGPVFLVREGELGAVDFRFDAWGGKYPPWDRDAAIPRRIAEALGIPRFAADFVLEGGSVDGDGRGTILTTESCLLHPNREPGRTRERMEQRLGDFLGAEQVIWLGGEVEGDDTDGHVDDLARFVAPGTVVAVLEEDPGERLHATSLENLRRLGEARDARGKPLSVATLPMPPPLRAGRDRLPASYANFYVANGIVLVPVFSAPSDQRALAILGELMPDREPIPIPARDLVSGLGAVHCLTQQEPA